MLPNEKDFYVVIPARMGGRRLPGKPLIDILGKPLIQRVVERVLARVDSGSVYVITEDLEVEGFCNKKGYNVHNTGKAETAIDRVALFAEKYLAKRYINVQGDEPAFNLTDLDKLLTLEGEWLNRVVFGKTKVKNEKEFFDWSKAKVVCDVNGRLIYSSRAGIPLTNSGRFRTAERAIWLYSFPRIPLNRYHKAGMGKIEAIEDNEIIRFLEIGEQVFCIDMKGDSWAVDHSDDIAQVEEILIQQGVSYG